MNSVNLIGRLTENPEMRKTQGGTAVVNFSIAVARDYKDQNGENPTDFIQIQAWRHTAEFVCKYFIKGARVGITGQIQTSKYKDKDGNNRTSVYVVASGVDFADAKKDSYGGAPLAPQYEAQQSADVSYSNFNEPADDDDLPF